jgi:hypothetical protein
VSGLNLKRGDTSLFRSNAGAPDRPPEKQQERRDRQISFLRIVRGCCVAIGLVLGGNPASAGSVFASAGDPLQADVPSITGTLDLRAHTDQSGPPRIGPNAIPLDTILGLPPTPAARFSGEIGGWLPGTGYTPIVGFSGRKPGPQRSVHSTSGMADPLATYVPAGPVSATGLLLASASIDPKLPGTAAALAEDPYPVAVGAYHYRPVITDFTLTTSDGEAGGTRYFATDSRFSGFLWQLTIGSKTPITGSQDLIIEFASNITLHLDHLQIEDEVRRAVAVLGGTAHLSSLPLFDVTYLVTQPIEYGTGVEADLRLVPEPSTLTLLGLGIVVLAGYGCRRGWATLRVAGTAPSP